MSSIDERVVEMKFDNKQFEAGVKQTMGSLDALNKSLKLEGATKGLTDVAAASKTVQLGHLEAGANAVAERFKAMSVIAVTALATIAHQAVFAGEQLVKSLTVAPLKSGLEEYETNLNSIQTILSNTQWQNTGLKDVTDALDILNLYSDQTIYNFAEMARNIGTFTAAGVKLNVAVDAIKGIANLAAISGSNSQQAATAMYQLSQAISSGKVALMDWNSVVNAGMGGKVFQDSLMETARIHGVAIDKMVKDAGSFRNTLENGWLTGQILTETLSKFTGDLTAAQLKTMGYNEQQIAGILKMGQTAQDAATKVKTMSALMNTLRESATSGWAQTWELIFGDFEEARTLFTQVNDVLGGIIKASADSRNEMISDWKELGGRTEIILAISNAFRFLIEILKPIRDAFREIFPATTGKQLYDLTVAIRVFAEHLKVGSETADNLRRTFAGVFALFGIGYDIIKQVVIQFLRLFGLATEGAGGFLEVTANIGDFLVELRKAIKEGEGFAKIFKLVGDVLSIPIKLIKLLAGYLGDLFDGFDAQEAAKSITGLIGQLEPLTRLGDAAGTAWEKVAETLDNVWSLFLGLGQKFAAFFDKFGPRIKEFMKDFNFQALFAGIDTGLFAAIVLMFRNLIGGGGIGGIFGEIKETINQLTNTLETMQTTLRAATLLQIALAVGVLTASMAVLSKIDAGGLTRALTAMGVMFTQLFSSMLILEKFSGFKSIPTIYALAGAMTVLGVAIAVLTISVKELSELKWDELAKGLTGVGALLTMLVLVGKFMPNPAGMISTSVGLVILAGAVKLLASSVTDLAGMSWAEMAQGLTGVAATLTALALFTKFASVEKGGVLAGAGIVLLAAGIKILASAMKDFATLSWEDIGKGLTGMAGGLTLMAAALIAIPPTSVFSAAAIIIVAASLGMLADALQKMGGMSWKDIGAGLTTLGVALTLISAALIAIPPTSVLSAAAVLIVAASLGMITEALAKMGGMSWVEIAKGLITLAGALTIIAVAVNVMTGALPGAAAMLIVAASLAILAPVLQMFGQLSWEEMAKGLLMLAGVFAVLGVAGLLLTPIVPTLLGLGVAVTLLGAGMLLAGAGLLAFSVGLTALAVSGAAGTAALVALVAGLVGIIPTVMEAIANGVIAFAKVLATAGPAMTEAMTTVILALVKAIDETSPKVLATLIKLLDNFLTEMAKSLPKMAQAAYDILIAILTSIKNNIAKVAKTALEIVAEFINGIAAGIPSVIQAGFNLIISFINGLAQAIRDNSPKMRTAGFDLALAIIDGMTGGLGSGVNKVIDAAKNVAKKALDAALKTLGIKSPSKEFEWAGEMSVEGLAVGFVKNAKTAADAASDMGDTTLLALRKTLSGVSDIVRGDLDMTPVISPVLDLTSIRKSAEEIGSMLRTKPISLEGSFTSAQDAAAGHQENQDISAANDTSDRGPDVTFIQNNTSPKALSSADIYRQTNNQISKAKGAVTT
jgi:tape measure domain-containing protein